MIKRPRLSMRKLAIKDSSELSQLATQLSQSCCRAEDQFWETRLDKAVNRLLADQDEASLSSALDKLFAQDISAYGTLIATVETCAESIRAADDPPIDVVLIAIPILAWSRFHIPAGEIPAEQLTTLRVHLQAHVLAAQTRLSLSDHLYSPDQLPQSYSETLELVERLTGPTLHGRNAHTDSSKLPETALFLSDTRYVIGAIAGTPGAPLFRWQEEGSSREDVARQWQQQSFALFRSLLSACAFEVMSPTAYHNAVRNADRASRPYSVKASIDFLTTVLGCTTGALQATVGGYYNQQLEEYRIGFCMSNSPEVLHGIVWPLIDPEDESQEAMLQIESLLREAGLGQVKLLSQRMPMEFCDDCGAPLFPNVDGESTHAELPEGAETSLPQQLH